MNSLTCAGILRKQQSVRRNGDTGYQVVILKKAEKRVLLGFQSDTTQFRHGFGHLQAIKQDFDAVINIPSGSNQVSRIVSTKKGDL